MVAPDGGSLSTRAGGSGRGVAVGAAWVGVEVSVAAGEGVVPRITFGSEQASMALNSASRLA
jgi:hypothetical protein